MRLTVAPVGIFLSLLIAVGHAQDVASSSQVKVTVFDENRAVIPNSEVVFKSDSKTIVSHTGMDGSVTVTLPSGRYAVTTSQRGFITAEVRDFQISAPEPGELKVVLKVAGCIGGSCVCEFDCGGSPPLLQPTTSDLPSVIPELSRDASAEVPLPEARVTVPDAATALRIAEPALKRVYGGRQINDEKPLKATLEDGVWNVYGTLWCSDGKGRRTSEMGKCAGGVAELKLRQSDGKILSIIHTK
jgi:hypothetical protein